MNLAVIGMGKIGLTLAVHYASKNNLVVGVDINQETVSKVNSGLTPFPGEKDLDIKLIEVINSGSLTCTTDVSFAIKQSDVILIVVPLFIDQFGKPDFRAIDSVTNEIGKNVKQDTVVIYETTLPIGTTRSRFTKRLEQLSNLTEGKNLFVAFSPERVLSGRIFEDLTKYPKIVGGVSHSSGLKAQEFYMKNIDFRSRPELSRPNGVWLVESSEAAEFVKLAETTYRDVNIGLANQFAKFAHKSKVNIHEVIAAANSQTYSHIHNPGISVGGHCIPVYPMLYLWSDPDASIVSHARNSNLDMPEFAVRLLKQHFGDLSRVNVGILGVTYRANVKETAYSGAFELVKILEKEQANTYVDDPMFSITEIVELGLNPLLDKEKIEVLVLHTSHGDYSEKFFSDFENLKIVLDGRNSVDPTWFNTAVKTIKL
jgi:nucleotide sugar dehydrogenase